MEPDREHFSGRAYNDEFQKRAADLELMIDYMKERADLVRKISNEEIIPGQARDMATTALSNELKENLLFFFDYLINFIHFGTQGLHHVDFEAGCTFHGGGIIQTDCCVLHIDDKLLDIPVEIGTRYIQVIFGSPDRQNPESVELYYKNEEAYYDRALGEISGRCELKITEELFPKRCIRVVMKLPAQTLIEKRVSL